MGSGGSLSFIGAVGVVAQQGNQAAAGGSAPTGVSIATTSTGNYDNAFWVECWRLGSGGENALTSNNGSLFSSNSADIEFVYGSDYGAMMNEQGGLLEFIIKGYIRATGGLTYAWDTDGLTVNHSGGSLQTAGWLWSTASTDQDETGQSDLINAIRIYHTSGGRGWNLMDSGDSVDFTLDATATNAGGTTAAAQCDMSIIIS